MLSNLYKFLVTESLVCKLLVCVMLVSAMAGCVAPKKTRHTRHPSTRPQTRPVDAKAQQRYYDLGLQQYSKEDYDDAEESFEQAVAYGPNTALGQKARENLKKVRQILKTLEEMESK
jgi:Tfp pilus assembly protein PilF